jgi:hypothetical protein
VSAPAGALTDAGLAEAAGGGAAVTATDGAAADVGAPDASCDEVAGPCADAVALAIATAIANAPATNSRGMLDGIEILRRRRMAMSSGPNRRAKQKPYHRRNYSSIGSISRGSDPEKTLTGTLRVLRVNSVPAWFLILGAGVTPAQGSVKPTVGFT